LGILNATKNASVAESTPKICAISISRINPSIREISVMLPTTKVDLKSCLLNATPVMKSRVLLKVMQYINIVIYDIGI